ncbi:MAG: hypothetical protein LUC85_08620 [Bacteroidales bacterium]|nr:hypothetical protein [Bacteroidales bacterium]
MTYIIFAAVAALLYGMAQLFHITYFTANILVYYVLIPLSWAFMIDRVIGWNVPWLTIAFTVCWILVFILTAQHLQEWCATVFKKSVDFLLWFKRWKWNYYEASVYICVWLPLLVYVALAALLFWRHPEWNWRPWAIGLGCFIAVAILSERPVKALALRCAPWLIEHYHLDPNLTHQLENFLNKD